MQNKEPTTGKIIVGCICLLLCGLLARSTIAAAQDGNTLVMIIGLGFLCLTFNQG